MVVAQKSSVFHLSSALKCRKEELGQSSYTQTAIIMAENCSAGTMSIRGCEKVDTPYPISSTDPRRLIQQEFLVNRMNIRSILSHEFREVSKSNTHTVRFLRTKGRQNSVVDTKRLVETTNYITDSFIAQYRTDAR